MPFYDYTCDACGTDRTEWQRMAESHKTKCPVCGKQAYRRLFSVPAIRTDSTFLAGVGTLRDQFGNEGELNRVVKAARKQGYEPRASDLYEPGLANKCGDPAAFIPSTDPKAHIRRVCKKRDITCHGMVEVKRRAK